MLFLNTIKWFCVSQVPVEDAGSSSSGSFTGVQGWKDHHTVWVGILVASLCGCIICGNLYKWRKEKKLRISHLHTDAAKLLGDEIQSGAALAKDVAKLAKLDEVARVTGITQGAHLLAGAARKVIRKDSISGLAVEDIQLPIIPDFADDEEKAAIIEELITKRRYPVIKEDSDEDDSTTVVSVLPTSRVSAGRGNIMFPPVPPTVSSSVKAKPLVTAMKTVRVVT